ncbi:MAG TPA: hypothetical protein V6C95_20450 [Coleofasciculaceae cyanobacterium]
MNTNQPQEISVQDQQKQITVPRLSQRSHSDELLQTSAKAKKNKALRKIIEFAAIAFVGFINPEAANWAVPALKLCFMLLDYLRKSLNK